MPATQDAAVTCSCFAEVLALVRIVRAVRDAIHDHRLFARSWFGLGPRLIAPLVTQHLEPHGPLLTLLLCFSTSGNASIFAGKSSGTTSASTTPANSCE